MTQQLVAGGTFSSRLIPEMRPLTVPPVFSSATSISAANHKYCVSGSLGHKDGPGATKTLTKIHWMMGTVTVVAGLTNVRVGVQGVNTGTGAPRRANGTYLGAGAGFVDHLISAFSSDTWFISGAINSGAGVTVVVGQPISAVMEITSLSAGESLVAKGLGRAAEKYNRLAPGALNRATAGTTYTAFDIHGSVILEFSDGSFGTILGAWPCSGVTTTNFSNASSQAEYGVILNSKFPRGAGGWWGVLALAASATGTVTLYSDPFGIPVSTGLTWSLDVAQVGAAASASALDEMFQALPAALAANTDYCLAVLATSANNLTVYSTQVIAAAHLDALAGQNCRMVNRSGSTAFANVNSGMEFPLLGIREYGFADDTSGGGGGSTGSAYIRRR